LFEAVGIYGLILGIMGERIQVTLPFLLIAAGAMITVFPTEEKLNRMSGMSNNELLGMN